MVESPRQRWALSNRIVTAFKVERDTVFWDRSLMGFGVGVNPSSDNVCVAQARSPKGLKRVLDVDTSCGGQNTGGRHIAPGVGSNTGRTVELFWDGVTNQSVMAE